VQDLEIRSLVRDLQTQNELDRVQGLRPPVWVNDSDEARLLSSAAYGRWLMAKDSKCTALKALQGRIWQEGFAGGELRGQVYPDVPPAFARWRRQSKGICIYSSGSVLAQRLLFETVISGDLAAYIAGFFDTRIGAKIDGGSYEKIAESHGHAPREFLFISDAAKEIEAARFAGMHAMLCDRAERASASPRLEKIIRTFDEVFPE
jgi:enolase-phosphatase E1